MFYHLGRFATRFRWWIVGAWAIAAILALPFAPQASHVLKSGGFSSPDSESQRAIDTLTQKLHQSQTIVQIIFTSDRHTVDSPQFIAQSERALTDLRNWNEVSSVTSFLDNPRQISQDRHAGYVNLQLKADTD